MDAASEIRAELADDWLPDLYRQKIRTQRTRAVSIDIPARENAGEIIYTLLGIELKVGKYRFACPDLATARYMRVFARIGCSNFAVPYDITKVSVAADNLETAWQMMLIIAADKSLTRSPRGSAQIRSKIIKQIRDDLAEIGAGDAMPAFDRPTRRPPLPGAN